MKANLLRLGNTMKSQVKSFRSYEVIHSLLEPFKYIRNEATTSGAVSNPCVCVFSCVINRRSQVQFESTFLNKVGQALLTLTFFSEAMLASSGCFSVSTEPLREATGLLFLAYYSLSGHRRLQPSPVSTESSI